MAANPESGKDSTGNVVTEPAPDSGIGFTDLASKLPTLGLDILIEGKYKLVDKIASGGMGVVYRAEHTFMNRTVAVKVLHAHLVESEEFLKRFRHEAQIASKLRHPNVVMMYDFGVYRNQPYLVMEYVQGESLKSIIEKGGPIPIARLRGILNQVCSALAEAHALGIVHRDLKPENIIISQGTGGLDTVQVLDFGVAKLVTQQREDASVITQAGVFWGTPKYASPEQGLSQQLDGRSDIYSLGVIMYEALTGVVPFDAPSVVEILMKHVHQQPMPLSAARPDLRIPKAVEDIVMRCLAKAPADRYQSAAELRKVVDEEFARHSYDLGADEARRRRRKQNTIVAAAVLGLLLIAGAVFVYVLSTQEISPKKEGKTSLDVPGTDDKDKTKDNNGIGTLLFGQPTALPSIAPTPVAEPTPVPTVEATPEPTIEPTFEPTAEPTFEPTFEPTQEPTFEPTVFPTPEPTVQFETPAPTPALTNFPTPEPTSFSTGDREEQARTAFLEGNSLYRKRRYSLAIPPLELAVKLQPENVDARLSLGICYLRMGKNQPAFQQFQAAVRLQPNSAPAHFNIACYHALQGNAALALDELERTISINRAARFWARGEPDLESLYDHPRFRQLVSGR